MIKIAFVGESYKMDSLDISAQTCINLYPEVYGQGDAKEVTALRSTSGLLLFAAMTNGSNKCRGMYQTSTGRMFVARGNAVSEFSATGTETFRFLLKTGATPSTSTIVRFADNGTKMLLTDGALGIVYDLNTNIATEVTDVDYPAGSFVDILDGYYLGNVPNTLLIRLSLIHI